jgi:hypothetical protein
MDSRKFINQEIQMYHLVSVDHNGMAAHITRSNCEGFLEVCVSNAVDGTDNMLWNGSEGDGNVRSEREVKVQTVKMETVALFGKGR